MTAKELILPDLEVEQKSTEYIVKLDTYVQQHFDELMDKFMEQFEKYCNKIADMQTSGRKGSLGFINFSLLQTNILAGHHQIRLDAYDASWYADRAECSGGYDVQEFYVFLDGFADELEKARRSSYNKVKLGDVQRVIFEESHKYLLFVTELVRVGLKSASKKDWFQAIKRDEVFIICIGAYQDKVDIVYKEDSTVKDAKAEKLFLEEKHQPAYSYVICNELNLSDGDYEDINLLFCSFDGCDFSHSSFRSNKILSSSFKQAVFRNTTMQDMEIFDTDFSGAVLEDVDFDGSALNCVSFAGAVLIRVKFAGIVYANALNFEGAKLVDTVVPETNR